MAKQSRTTDNLNSYTVQQYLAVSGELENRRLEALRLYEPTPFQEEFHQATTKQAIIRKGNQVGGSLCNFVEVARAVTGQDPYDKYPKRDGVAVVLGYGEKHIGRVIHKYLFRAGAFRIIRDLDTGQWRTFRPWDDDKEINGKPGDRSRKDEAKPAPPLIPPRFIEGRISYQKKSEHIFSYVQFKTGWELHALNSAGEPEHAQGFQTNLYDIDEDVANAGWLEEAIGRCSFVDGIIRWNAVPHAKTDDMMQMIEQAEDEEKEGLAPEKRTTTLITATVYDNPYMSDEARETNVKIWRSKGEDVYQKRALGIVTMDSVLMYPGWSRYVHQAVRWDDPRNEVQKILADRHGEPPFEWCRYMIVDPGHTVCAVGFFAVPPPDLGDYKVLYDELYLQGCNAQIFGQKVEPKLRGFGFQDFIIDAHGGRLRDIGSGELPQRQYENQLERRDIACFERGSRFKHGSDNVAGREDKLRQWLHIRENGYPTLLVVQHKCPAFCREIERFKKRTVKQSGLDVPIDEGNRRANTHMVEVCEYGAADGLKFVPPKKRSKVKGIVKEILEGRARRAAQRQATHGGGRQTISLAPRGSG